MKLEQAELLDLIRRSRQGDPEAQEALILAAQNKIYYHCKKILKHEEDAQDATQDVLIVMITSLDKLKEPAAFWGWVNGITANRCRHLLSSPHKEWQIPEDEEGNSMLDSMENLDEQLVPEKALDNEETRRMILGLVDDLPPEPPRPDAMPAALAAEGLGMICAHDLKRPGQENGWRGLCRVEDGKPRREALPIRNWGEIYIRLARSILRGGWDELNAAGAINYWWGFASGAVDVQLAPSVPDGPRELLRVLREALVHGELTPFHRRITDQAGTLRNDGEQWFSPEKILRMDWLCSNVTGKIPDYEELLPMAQPMVRLLGVYRDALQPKKRGPLL